MIICAVCLGIIAAMTSMIVVNVAAANGMIPMPPPPTPLSMEQIADMHVIQQLQGEDKKLWKAIKDVNSRITEYNNRYDGLSRAKLNELEYLNNKVNELDNRIPPAEYRSFEVNPSGKRRGLFNK